MFALFSLRGPIDVCLFSSLTPLTSTRESCRPPHLLFILFIFLNSPNAPFFFSPSCCVLCVESFPDGNQPPPKEEEDSGGKERNLIDAISFWGLFLSREGIPAPKNFFFFCLIRLHPHPPYSLLCMCVKFRRSWLGMPPAHQFRLLGHCTAAFFHPFCRRVHSILFIYFLRRTHTFIPCASLVSSLCVYVWGPFPNGF